MPSLLRKPGRAACFMVSLSCPFSLASPVQAGWLASGSLAWGGFSFRPLAVENTPNYYALGAELQGGYSIGQVWDLAVFASYLPAAAGSTQLGVQNAALLNYGAVTALRINDKIYIGLRGFVGDYNLVKATAHPAEVTGQWQGSGFGVSLGAIFRIDRRNYWQLSLDLSNTVFMPKGVAKDGELTVKNRQMDGYRITGTYTFNGFVSTHTRESLFKNVF